MSENQTNPMPADLLNQILSELKSLNQRIERIEARQMETNKLDKIIGEIAELKSDFNKLRSELADFKKETHNNFRTIKEMYYDNGREINALDRRIEAVEDNQKPKQ